MSRKKRKNDEDGSVVTGSLVEMSLLGMLPGLLKTKNAKIYIGVNGVRVDVPGLPPFMVRSYKVRKFLWVHKDAYEMRFDNLWAPINKGQFNQMLDESKRFAASIIGKKSEDEDDTDS